MLLSVLWRTSNIRLSTSLIVAVSVGWGEEYNLMLKYEFCCWNLNFMTNEL